jgi:hypothetical protein
MTTEEAEKELKICEDKARLLNKLLSEYYSVLNTMNEIDGIKYAGRMMFIGKSGKIGEDKPIVEININNIGGCVAVPELLNELANNELKRILGEFEKLSPKKDMDKILQIRMDAEDIRKETENTMK